MWCLDLKVEVAGYLGKKRIISRKHKHPPPCLSSLRNSTGVDMAASQHEKELREIIHMRSTGAVAYYMINGASVSAELRRPQVTRSRRPPGNCAAFLSISHDILAARAQPGLLKHNHCLETHLVWSVDHPESIWHAQFTHRRCASVSLHLFLQSSVPLRVSCRV